MARSILTHRLVGRWSIIWSSLAGRWALSMSGLLTCSANGPKWFLIYYPKILVWDQNQVLTMFRTKVTISLFEVTLGLLQPLHPFLDLRVILRQGSTRYRYRRYWALSISPSILGNCRYWYRYFYWQPFFPYFFFFLMFFLFFVTQSLMASTSCLELYLY